ncbi:MAG TPA: D-xylose ABC transporter ATP-binding protein [Lachnospiraceae bacterium]|nr:D-xylose ABC transporter ATP-binding protein [Lachnospiraceae bacterium]
MDDIVLEMKHISKQFVGVKALDDVSLSVRRGEVHAICGENGAGKSTLMKILNGIYRADSGEIWLNGKLRNIQSPEEAHKAGLSIIFQEFNLVDTLSVAENIYLGRLREKGVKLNWRAIERRAEEQLKNIGAEIDPRIAVSRLSVSQKQMVEIAKALSYDANVIVMDEPSATLTDKEAQKLFSVISDLKKKQITVIYISHKMDEVFALSDRITVLRDGVAVSTAATKDTTRREVIASMVGRAMENEYPVRQGRRTDETVMRVTHIRRKPVLHDVSFEVKKGEILGIAGLVGAGRTELVRAVFGADPVSEGQIEIKGVQKKIKSPMDAIKNGVALVNEDRKELGLVLKFPIAENISICKIGSIVRKGFIQRKQENRIAEEYTGKLAIKSTSCRQKCVFLSGGNQQKVVLAKWLYADADILLLDEPTRGIDVGSKYEIYKWINRLADAGKAVVMISSELPEILGLSDRILVLHRGKVAGEFENEDKTATAEEIMSCAIG